jgi:hypothetical protein
MFLIHKSILESNKDASAFIIWQWAFGFWEHAGRSVWYLLLVHCVDFSWPIVCVSNINRWVIQNISMQLVCLKLYKSCCLRWICCRACNVHIVFVGWFLLCIYSWTHRWYCFVFQPQPFWSRKFVDTPFRDTVMDEL